LDSGLLRLNRECSIDHPPPFSMVQLLFFFSTWTRASFLLGIYGFEFEPTSFFCFLFWFPPPRVYLLTFLPVPCCFKGCSPFLSEVSSLFLPRPPRAPAWELFFEALAALRGSALSQRLFFGRRRGSWPLSPRCPRLSWFLSPTSRPSDSLFFPLPRCCLVRYL